MFKTLVRFSDGSVQEVKPCIKETNIIKYAVIGRETFDFKKVTPILKEAGFTHFTVFKNRKPEFLPL